MVKKEWNAPVIDFVIVFGLSWFFWNTLPIFFATLQGNDLGAWSFGMAFLIYLALEKTVLKYLKG